MKPNELLQTINLNIKPKSGIYMIYYTLGNKAYIGQSVYITNRWCDHRSRLKLGKHDNPHLQNIYNKHGLNAFQFLRIEEGTENLSEREVYWISQIDKDSCLNIGPTGTFKMSEETKNKIRLANIGKHNIKHTEEAKKKMSEFWTGKPGNRRGKKLSEEAKQKIRLANLGKKQSEETIRKRIEGTLRTKGYIK